MIMYDYVQLARYYQNQDKCKREKGNEGVIANKDYQPIYFAEALEVMKPILHKGRYYSRGAGTAMWVIRIVLQMGALHDRRCSTSIVIISGRIRVLLGRVNWAARCS